MNPNTFPFWLTLTEETQRAYLIAEAMMNAGILKGVGRTAMNLGFGNGWNASRLAGGLGRFSAVVAEYGISIPQAEAVIAHGMRVVAAATTAAETGVLMGALTAIGRWLGIKGAIAAGVAGVVVVTVVLGGVTYVVANAAGELSADAPVQQGDAMTGRTAAEGGIEPSSSSSTVPPPHDADVPQLDDEAKQRYGENLQEQLGTLSSDTGSDDGNRDSDDWRPSRVRRDDDRDDDRDGDHDDDRRTKRHDSDDDDDRRKKHDSDDDDDHHSSRSSKHDSDDDDDSGGSSCSDDDE